MLNYILMGIVRHIITSIGGAIVAHGLQIVDHLPQVQDAKSVAAGAATVALGLLASAYKNAQHAKLQTQSGPIYKTNN